MQDSEGKFTQGEYDELRNELAELEMLKTIGNEVDEKRIEEIKAILKRQVGTY